MDHTYHETGENEPEPSSARKRRRSFTPCDALSAALFLLVIYLPNDGSSSTESHSVQQNGSGGFSLSSRPLSIQHMEFLICMLRLKQEACQLGKITSVNTQRRVTFHLPDGSQESCSDSGLGDPEPSSTASTTQPLPLSFPQEEYYEQTSPNSRTEGDGNSDPESTIEVNLQKALAEASETCTQECLILGHSDSCWMPPALAQFQGSGNNSPTSTPITTAIAGTMPSFGFQQSCARGAKANMMSMGVMDGRHTLGRSVPKKDELDKGISRPQFYNTLDRHCSKKEDPVKVIPLASFSSPGQQTPSGGSSSFLHEHQL